MGCTPRERWQWLIPCGLVLFAVGIISSLMLRVIELRELSVGNVIKYLGYAFTIGGIAMVAWGVRLWQYQRHLLIQMRQRSGNAAFTVPTTSTNQIIVGTPVNSSMYPGTAPQYFPSEGQDKSEVGPYYGELPPYTEQPTPYFSYGPPRGPPGNENGSMPPVNFPPPPSYEQATNNR